MAHVKNSIITGKFSGQLGKELVFRNWEGKTIVAKAPGSRTGAPTPKQVVTQDKFLLAAKYAKAILDNTDQSMAEAYTAVLKARQNVYSRALEDFMTAPVVKAINTRNYTGIAGSKIAVRAIDDFRVVNVHVEIISSTGTSLESGTAVQDVNGIDWIYSTTVANSQLSGTTISAVATDVPGNEGTLEVIL